MSTTPFSKPYSSPSDLVCLLKSRGLSITDEHKAEHYLEHIGYYRLSAYMYPFLRKPKSHHIYKRGATFGKVMTLYSVIKYFLDVISPNNDMLAKLRWLFVDFPEIDLAAMGFPKGWEMEPIWK